MHQSFFILVFFVKLQEMEHVWSMYCNMDIVQLHWLLVGGEGDNTRRVATLPLQLSPCI